MGEENLVFVGVTKTKSGQTRYIYYDPEHKMTINLAKPLEDYDYSKAQPPSEEVKRHYRSDVYFLKEVKETEEGYQATFEQEKPNTFVTTQEAREEAFNRALRGIAQKTGMPVSDTGLYVIPPVVTWQSQQSQQPQAESEGKYDFTGYEEYYRGLYEMNRILNQSSEEQSKPPGYHSRTRGITPLTPEEVRELVEKGKKTAEEYEDKIWTLSGWIYEKTGLVNEPYQGEAKEDVWTDWARWKWTLKQSAIDLAQGGIGFFTAPVDIPLILAQREKIDWSQAKEGIIQSLKTGELGLEILGGVLASAGTSALINAVNAGVGTVSRTSANVMDDLAKQGAGKVDDVLKAGGTKADDVLKAGGGKVDDVLKAGGSTDDVVKNIADDLTPDIRVDLGDIKVEGTEGYLRIDVRGTRGVIDAKGGVFSIEGELWKKPDLLREAFMRLKMETPEEALKLQKFYGINKKTIENLEKLMKSTGDDVLKAGGSTDDVAKAISQDINIKLKDGVIEGKPGYLKIEARGYKGEVYAKGGVLEIKGDIWQHPDVLQDIIKEAKIFQPDEALKLKKLWGLGAKAKAKYLLKEPDEVLDLTKVDWKKVDWKKGVIVSNPFEGTSEALNIAKEAMGRGTIIPTVLVPESFQRAMQPSNEISSEFSIESGKFDITPKVMNIQDTWKGTEQEFTQGTIALTIQKGEQKQEQKQEEISKMKQTWGTRQTQKTASAGAPLAPLPPQSRGMLAFETVTAGVPGLGFTQLRSTKTPPLELPGAVAGSRVLRGKGSKAWARKVEWGDIRLFPAESKELLKKKVEKALKKKRKKRKKQKKEMTKKKVARKHKSKKGTKKRR